MIGWDPPLRCGKWKGRASLRTAAYLRSRHVDNGFEMRCLLHLACVCVSAASLPTSDFGVVCLRRVASYRRPGVALFSVSVCPGSVGPVKLACGA